jgi:LacI family transcriptional regulator
MNMKATMKDVSYAAGVSVATVSHVINNTKYVTDEMRKKVLDAITLLQYKQNITARNFKMGKHLTIGFVVPDISNIFFSTLINEIEMVVSKQNYMIVVVNTQENPEKEEEQLRRLSSGLVDGLIVASAFDDYTRIRDIIPKNFPIILLDRKPHNCTCDTILISGYDAVFQGVENLLQKGHRKICCITGSQHMSTLDERLCAFRDCHKKYGVEIDEDLVLRLDITKKDIIADLKRAFPRNIGAAVILQNTLTLGAFFYLTNHNMFNNGLDAVGYSDASWRHYALKYMDVVVQPIDKMGTIAGERILERITHPNKRTCDIILQAKLVKKSGT